MPKENEMEILILTENTGYDGSTYLVAADPEHPIDPCKFWMETREETKEEIQELMDSGYLNWDRQNVTIPENIIQYYKAAGVQEFLSRQVMSNGFLPHEQIVALKKAFKKGTRVKLIHMSDWHDPIPDGTHGTVAFVDDAGQIHVSWDNGRALSIVPEDDLFMKED